MAKKELKIAAAYIRVSTDDQLEYSPDSQLREIRRFAKTHGYIVPEEYIFHDDGISATSTKRRTGFQRMIAAAKLDPKPFDCVLVWKLNRFSRNREDSVVYKSLLRKRLGISVISVSEGLGESKASRYGEAVIEVADEMYSENLAEDVRRGMIEKTLRGEYNAAAPFGYKLINKHLVPDEVEAPIVTQLFRDAAAETTPLWELPHRWNAIGYRTKRGNLWELRTIKYILRNPIYYGMVRWCSNGRLTHKKYDPNDVMLVKGIHDPLVDYDTWLAVQRRLDAQAAMYNKYEKKKYDVAMLQGVLKCSNCGSTLTRNGRGGYQCIGYAHGTCTVSHYIAYALIDQLVLATIEDDMQAGAFRLAVRSTQPRDDSGIIDLQIKREQQKLDRIKEAYTAGVDTLEEYRENKKRITQAIIQLEAKRPQKPKEVDTATRRRFASTAKAQLERLRDPSVKEDEKNRIIRSFVEKIVFDRAAASVEIYYYMAL